MMCSQVTFMTTFERRLSVVLSCILHFILRVQVNHRSAGVNLLLNFFILSLSLYLLSFSLHLVLHLQFKLLNGRELLVVNLYELAFGKVRNVLVVAEKPSQICLSDVITFWTMLPTFYLCLHLLIVSPHAELTRVQVST